MSKKVYRLELTQWELQKIIFCLSNEIDIQQQFIRDETDNTTRVFLTYHVDAVTSLKDKLQYKLDRINGGKKNAK